MGKTILKVVGVILGTLLFPFLFTLLISGKATDSSNQEAANLTEVGDLSKISAVGEEDLDQYIMSVLAAYVPLELKLDTMKAMAVIARTSVYYKWQQLQAEGKSMETLTKEEIGLPTAALDTIKQKYGQEKAATYISTLENVVYSTKDEIITYEGKPILACYHYANAGKTRDYGESTGYKLPYLVSVDSSKDIEASVGISSLKITFADAASMLEKAYDVGKLDYEKLMDQLSIEKQDSTGYVLKVKVGEKTITGEEFQQCFYLNSTNFYFTQYEGNLRIICKGKGSGYGFSQYGANEMAVEGKSYQELLTWYYPETVLTTITE